MLPDQKRINALSAEGLHVLALQNFLPPERLTIPQHAARKRILSNEGGGYVGRWKNEEVPYMVEPAECSTSLDFLTVAVSGPGQSAKTAAVGENHLLYRVDCDPANMLWYMQTDDGLEAYVKSRIDPMIDAHECMSSRLGRKATDNSLHYKRFTGMQIEFLSATPSNLINKSAPIIFADEVDAYPESLGDVKATLDVRRQTFGDWSMLIACSHCDRARGLDPAKWTAGIMAIYADSDRRVWYWPCRQCEGWSSPAPIATRHMALEYETSVELPSGGRRPTTLDEVQASARLICPINGCALEDGDRRWMNARGRWVGLGQEISPAGVVTGQLVSRKTAGFWVVGAMSPLNMGIGALARARVKAEREYEISGEEQSLREVMVKQWGIPYSPPKQVGSVDANDLAERSMGEAHKLGVVPDGVRFLTCAVDVQATYFEFMVRGWGDGAESWVIDHGRITSSDRLATPSTSPKMWDQLLEVFLRAYPLAGDNGRGMLMQGCCFDSGGAPGVTAQGYEAWSRWKRARHTRFIGTVNGRHVHTIIPTQGVGTPNALKLQVVYPDTVRAANKASAGGTVPLARFNSNLFKDDLGGQLQVATAGEKYIHFPADLRSPEPPHLFFEQVVAERQLPNGKWERVSPSARNEALDLLVMTHVIANLHGLTRIVWDRPPPWAAPWDRNSKVVPLEIKSAAVIKPPAPGAPRKKLSDRLA